MYVLLQNKKKTKKNKRASHHSSGYPCRINKLMFHFSTSILFQGAYTQQKNVWKGSWLVHSRIQWHRIAPGRKNKGCVAKDDCCLFIKFFPQICQEKSDSSDEVWNSILVDSIGVLRSSTRTNKQWKLIQFSYKIWIWMEPGIQFPRGTENYFQ